MAITINWATKVINVPQADLTPLGGSLYQLNIDSFRLTLKDLEDDEAGIPFLRTHDHNTESVLAGITFARQVKIINGYTVQFGDGQYGVNLVGANSNIPDVLVRNQVSVNSQNSAGLIVAGSGLSAAEALQLQEMHRLHGLEVGLPLVVDGTGNTRRVPASGGTISQTIATVGGVTTVTRQ